MTNTNETDLPTPYHDFPKEKYTRLRSFLPWGMGFFIGIPTLAMLLMTYFSTMSHLDIQAKETMALVGRKTLDQTKKLLDDAANTAALNAILFKPENRGEGFLKRFDASTRQQLKTHPHFGLLYFSDNSGNHWLSKREQDGTIRTRIIRRLIDTSTSVDILKEAAEMPRKTPSEQSAIAKRISPFIQTTWYGLDEKDTFIQSGVDPIKIYDPRLRPWYKGAVEKNGLYWTGVYAWEDKYQGATKSQVGITAAIPIYEQGKRVGVAATDIVLKSLSDFIRQLQITPNGRAFIFDPLGRTIGLPNYKDVVRNTAESGSKKELQLSQNLITNISDQTMGDAFMALSNAIIREKESPIILDDEKLLLFESANETNFGYFVPFHGAGDLNWIVGVVVPEDDFKGQIKKSMWISLVLVLLAMVIVVMIGSKVSRVITGPLNHLARDVKRLSAFDMRPTADIQTFFQEIAFISFAFQKMRTSLRTIVAEVVDHSLVMKQSSEGLAQIAINMSEGVGKVKWNANQVAGSTQGMSINMETAATSATDTNQRMLNLADGIQQTNENMVAITSTTEHSSQALNGVADTLEQASNDMVLVREAAERTNTNVSGVSHSVETLTQSVASVRIQCEKAQTESRQAADQAKNAGVVMEKLSHSAEEIGGVVDLINSIAEQSSMLALNAFIEAAGAGEVGKGFGVVANEVKELAKQTARLTGDISDRIGDIRDNTVEVGNFTRQITERIQRIDLANGEILTAVDEQGESIQQMAVAIRDTSKETSQVTVRIRESTERITEVNQSVQEINTGIAQVTQNVGSASSELSEMNQNVGNVSNEIQEIANSVGDASGTAKEIAEAMSSVNNAAGDMQSLSDTVRADSNQTAEVATKLKEMMDRFKIQA